MQESYKHVLTALPCYLMLDYLSEIKSSAIIHEICHSLVTSLDRLFFCMSLLYLWAVNRRLDEWVKLEQLDLDSVETVVDEKVEDKVTLHYLFVSRQIFQVLACRC